MEKPLPRKITFILDSLREPLEAYCEKTGEKPSQVVRKAVAKFLKTNAPTLQVGNPNFMKQSK